MACILNKIKKILLSYTFKNLSLLKWCSCLFPHIYWKSKCFCYDWYDSYKRFYSCQKPFEIFFLHPVTLTDYNKIITWPNFNANYSYYIFLSHIDSHTNFFFKSCKINPCSIFISCLFYAPLLFFLYNWLVWIC